MNKAEDEIPGVVLRFRSSEKVKTTSNKKLVRVVLEAEISDEQIWLGVQQKLQELKIYTIEDFKTEMLSALRRDNAYQERQLTALRADHAKVTEENRKMRDALSVLGAVLQGCSE